jgi:hypothetical protein
MLLLKVCCLYGKWTVGCRRSQKLINGAPFFCPKYKPTLLPACQPAANLLQM